MKRDIRCQAMPSSLQTIRRASWLQVHRDIVAVALDSQPGSDSGGSRWHGDEDLDVSGDDDPAVDSRQFLDFVVVFFAEFLAMAVV